MKQDDIKYIKEMLEMQAELDAKVEEVHHCIIERDKLEMALLDEIGELTHELKYEWCWWKFTQPKVDREKVLGELVDVWHFVLSYINHFTDDDYIWWNEELEPLLDGESVENISNWSGEEKSLSRLVEYIKMMYKYEINYGFRLAVLTEYLGFTIEDVYNAYIAKNKINRERIERGY